MTHLLFCHGNGFPSGTYSQFFKALRPRGFEISPIDRVGHTPQYPVTNNWPHLIDEWEAFVTDRITEIGEPVFLMGHSLGGMLSAMLAGRLGARAKTLSGHGIRGVLMLDTPLVGGWRASLVRGAKVTGLVERLGPGQVSARRRAEFPSIDAAREHFAAKPVFARWHPEALEDYLRHGLEPHEEGYRLRFRRDVETLIYNGLPHHLEAYFAKHRPEIPMALVAGLQSREIRQGGLQLSRRLTAGRVFHIDGNHLYPMETPRLAAACAEAALLNLMGCRD